MAVYTSLDRDDFVNLLRDYDLGAYISHGGIVSGVMNTTYKFLTTKSRYILTIFEVNQDIKETQNLVQWVNYLKKNNVLCPAYRETTKNTFIGDIKGKPFIIVDFIDNEPKLFDHLTEKDCFEAGKLIATLHNISEKYPLTSAYRPNKRGNAFWREILEKVSSNIKNYPYSLNQEMPFDGLKNTYQTLEKTYPNKLPKGIIHGDFFPDNVFFNKEKPVAIIDFDFSGVDYWIYDLALSINAWCFDEGANFLFKRSDQFLKGYFSKRALSKDEEKNFLFFLKASAYYITLARLYDLMFPRKNLALKAKDPLDFYKRVLFHDQKNSIEDYYQK